MDNVKVINSKGFTLVEVIAVIAILGILAGIAVPSVIGLIEEARKDVCDANVLQLERVYERYLALESVEHSEFVFEQYLLDYDVSLCPIGGDISYLDGEVRCSVHHGDDDGEGSEEQEVSVPFL
jgi:prepilin-type N-terminal cleavage/methylation domain-containing protein